MLSMSAQNALLSLLELLKVFFHFCKIPSGTKPIVIARIFFPLVILFVLSLRSAFLRCSVEAWISHAFPIFLLVFRILVCTMFFHSFLSALQVIMCSNISLLLLQNLQLNFVIIF